MNALTSRLPRILALAAVAGVTALVVVLVAGQGDEGPATSRAGAEAVVAETSVTPRSHLFGDTLTARIDFVLDRRRVHPAQVQVDAIFAPYTLVGQPTRIRRDAGSVTHLRYAAVLRCLTALCVPEGRELRVQFPSATVTYRSPEGSGREVATTKVEWPPVAVYRRVDPAVLEGLNPLNPPWRADLLAIAKASYRLVPGFAAGLLIFAGVALLGAGIVLLARLVPKAAPLPVPEPPPAPELSPLERALRLLENPSDMEGSGGEDERKALELVAGELARRGEDAIAAEARELAWSEPGPPAREAQALAARVRRLIEEGPDGRA